MTKDELIKQCKYYKGEEACPYGGTIQEYHNYSTLENNPRSFWWYAEKEVVESNLFDSVTMGIQCKVHKHMEYAPLSETECIRSYLNI